MLDSIKENNISEKQNKIIFRFFCIWSYVLLCRPQDLFLSIKSIHPALVVGLLTLGIVFVHLRELSTAPPFFQERQVKYYSTLLLIIVLGIPFSIYIRLSFMAIFTEYITVVIFFFIFYKVVNEVSKLRTILLIGSLGNGLYSAFTLSRGTIVGDERLSFSTMFDSNDLAFFVLGFLPLNLLFISADNPRWVRLASLFSIGAGVLLVLKTGSRGGFLGLGVAVIMLLMIKTKTISFFQKVALVASGLMIFSFSTINAERYKTLLSVDDDYNVSSETGRLSIWKFGIRKMLSNPLTGVGVNCFSKAVGNDREARGAEVRNWQAPHNSLVQIGTETGVIGLILFMLISWNVCKIFRKVKKYAISNQLIKISEMGLVGFISMFTSAMFLSQAYSIYWAFYVVFSACVSQLLIKESHSSTSTGNYL